MGVDVGITFSVVYTGSFQLVFSALPTVIENNIKIIARIKAMRRNLSISHILRLIVRIDAQLCSARPVQPDGTLDIGGKLVKPMPAVACRIGDHATLGRGIPSGGRPLNAARYSTMRMDNQK
jgi:hypothetical protein